MKTAIELITEERSRQISQGWLAEHDDTHDEGELARAAAEYAIRSTGLTMSYTAWPWGEFPKRDTPLNDLVKAGALIVAEIERRQRASDISADWLRPEGEESQPQQAIESNPTYKQITDAFNAGFKAGSEG